jgi:acetyl-CoA carboxylase biotin carboxylase subunit
VFLLLIEGKSLFVLSYYDSLIAKVTTSGANRAKTIERMENALENFVVAGIDTTIPFLRSLLNQPDYRKGQVNTRWIENLLGQQFRNNK